MILTAEYILPISSPPILCGAVVVKGSQIVAVGREDELCRRFPDLPKQHLSGCILMPGLVNAHTHLELSILKGRVSTQNGFTPWILSLIQEKMKLSIEKIEESIRLGVKESLAAGTTCLGDITNTPMGLQIIEEKGLRAILFLEVLGRDVENPAKWKEDLVRRVNALQSESLGLTTIGLAPHTPYTLTEQRFRLLSELLAEVPLPYTIHVSESCEEMEYFLHHRGKIKTRLFPAVGWSDLLRPGRTVSPLAYLDELGLVTDRLLAAHGVHLTFEDLDRMAKRSACLVLCLRSNQNLSVGHPPIHAMLERGIPIGLGTDSLAGNSSLSIWDEMRALYALHSESGSIEAESILRMATLGGAEGLGLDSKIGSIETGKEADLIAVEWCRSEKDDPATDLIEQTQNRHIHMVMVGGKILMNKSTT